jgi:serine/threonine protein kinase
MSTVNDPFDSPGSPRPGSNNAMPPGSVVGGFTIQGLVAEGGFAIVYRALDNVTQREVAVKEFMPQALARRGPGGRLELHAPQCAAAFAAGLDAFVDDAKLLARLDHKALAKVLRVFEAHDTAYMVMPFYHGRTVEQVLRKSTKMDEPWVKAMLAPLLDALETLHGAGRLHSCVAPGNILILEDGGPVLLDFGAARRVVGDMTQAVNDVLHAGYAPVEQHAVDSSMPQGPWTDIYALAAVVRHAITGKAPPPSVTRMARDSMKPLAQVAPRFGPSFLRAIDYGLAVRPEDRPQSIGEFRQALGLAVVSVRLPPPASAAIATVPPVPAQRVAAILKPPPASTMPPSPAAAKPTHVPLRPPPASGAAPRRQWLPIAIVLVTMLAVAGAGYLALQTVTSESSPETVALAPVQPPPVAPTPETPTAPPVTPRSPQSDAGPAAPAPAAASPAPSVAPTPPAATGRVTLDIKPWGEVVIDGRARGLTPPLKVLQLAEGAHRIEVRNPVGPPLVREVTVTAAGRVEISHTFR